MDPEENEAKWFSLSEAESARRRFEPLLIDAMEARRQMNDLEDCLSAIASRIQIMGGVTVNYDVAIDPGPVYHLAFVKFDNVSDELRSLLIKNWQMLPGDPFNEVYVASFIMTAQKNDPVLGRTLANVKANYNVTADPQTHDVNVVLHLEKR